MSNNGERVALIFPKLVRNSAILYSMLFLLGSTANGTSHVGWGVLFSWL